MIRSILLISLVVSGCNVKTLSDSTRFYETDDYIIPDSLKQKYLDFVSTSISGCKDNCRSLFDDIKAEGGRLYGCKKYLLQTKTNLSGNGPWDSVIQKKDMTVQQLESVPFGGCVE